MCIIRVICKTQNIVLNLIPNVLANFFAESSSSRIEAFYLLARERETFKEKELRRNFFPFVTCSVHSVVAITSQSNKRLGRSSLRRPPAAGRTWAPFIGPRSSLTVCVCLSVCHSLGWAKPSGGGYISFSDVNDDSRMGKKPAPFFIRSLFPSLSL